MERYILCGLCDPALVNGGVGFQDSLDPDEPQRVDLLLVLLLNPILLIFCLVQGSLSKETFSVKNLKRSLFLGALNPFLYYNLLFIVYSLLPAQEAQAINFSWPVMLALLAPAFLGQRIHIRSIAGIAVSFSGSA